MIPPFDRDAFLRRSLNINSKGKTFAMLAEEVKQLRKEYRGIKGASARKYVSKDLNRRLLMFATDTMQPPALVDRLFRRCIQDGFNELHALVSATIDYAEYCNELGNPKKGLRWLQRVRKSLSRKKKVTAPMIEAIDKAIHRFETRLASTTAMN